jgi:large subunit ribosomal protein L9
MEVILLERIRNLGQLGEKVKVKPGYARNYLIPQAKAVYATKANVEAFEAKRAEYEKAAAEALAAAQARAEQLNALELTMESKTIGEDGKLYGSIGVHEVLDLITGKGVAVEKREVNLPSGPIRSIGEYEVEVLLHSEVVAKLTLTVTEEK